MSKAGMNAPLKMSKREYAHQLASDLAQAPQPSKRPRLDAAVAATDQERVTTGQQTSAGRARRPDWLTEDSEVAITTLLEHSDELFRCITLLRESTSSASSPPDVAASRERLAALSKQLLPIFRVLGSQRPGGGDPADNSGAVAVPAPVTCTKWTSADIVDALPPLPEVTDASVERAALTHSSVVSSSVHESYDRLEWLGDAYLELFATCFIHETFPDMPHGKCSQIREMLVRNESLSQWCLGYGLDKRARLPPEFNRTNKTKHLGDIFEAYVGAIIVSDPIHGVTRTASWLKGLWAMSIAHKIREEEQRQQRRQSHGTATGSSIKDSGSGPLPGLRAPKEQLATLLVVPGVKLRYVDLPRPKQKDRDSKLDLFCVGVYLDGWGEKDVLLGRGVALGKKEAGTKAAQMAMENKKLVKKYIDMKQAFLGASKAQE